MNLKTRNKVNTMFNMSSLSDVIFLLLIFFMLTSQLVTPNAIKLLPPKADGQTRSPKTLVVSVTEDLSYYVDTKRVEYSQLKNEIIKKVEEYSIKYKTPDPSVVLRVDQRLSVQDLVNVMKLGAEIKVRMILETKPE
ncbi:MAG TPA: biopolymer transporter ExbD [Bacteroidetes bacterium]|nr:biopolymer transporter ExbD [Bacteroidota bacterium]